jgi:hypothetical protein
MKSLRIAAAMMFLGCGPALAQVGMTTSPTPGLEATSPLGMSPGAPVAPAGIPFGATELASPGISSAVTGSAGMTAGMTGYGVACAVSGIASSGTTNAATYDGGGIATGTSSPGGAANC